MRFPHLPAESDQHHFSLIDIPGFQLLAILSTISAVGVIRVHWFRHAQCECAGCV